MANRRRIFIAAMKDDEGQWLESRDSIGKYLCTQFDELFKAEDNFQLEPFIHPCFNFIENEGIMSNPSKS